MLLYLFNSETNFSLCACFISHLCSLYFLPLQDSAVHISRVFPSLFSDPSHRVRMYMAEAIGILFITFNSENIGVPGNPAIQDKLFDIVTDALTESLVVEVCYVVYRCVPSCCMT